MQCNQLPGSRSRILVFHQISPTSIHIPPFDIHCQYKQNPKLPDRIYLPTFKKLVLYKISAMGYKDGDLLSQIIRRQYDTFAIWFFRWISRTTSGCGRVSLARRRQNSMLHSVFYTLRTNASGHAAVLPCRHDRSF